MLIMHEKESGLHRGLISLALQPHFRVGTVKGAAPVVAFGAGLVTATPVGPAEHLAWRFDG